MMADRKMPDLLAAHWLVAGQRPAMRPAPCDQTLRQRAAMAVAAGYNGIGIHTDELRRELARHGASTLRAMLADEGIVHVELEVLADWWLPERDSRRELAGMQEAGSAIGARMIKATGDFSDDPVSLDRMAEAFAPVAAMAGEGGVPLALEIIAFSNILTIPDALHVIGDNIGRGAGLMLDSWHFARREVAVEPLLCLPKGAILGVELADIGASIIDDIFTDTLDHRHVPGEGAFDFAPFIAAVRQAGYDGPIGLEVLSSSLRQLPVERALLRCAAAAGKILEIGH